MNNILWVEDFGDSKGANTYSSVTNNVLGVLTKKHNIQIDDEINENELKNRLEKHHIVLKTNLTSAFDYINNNLDKVDLIILDIDLKIKETRQKESEQVVQILNNFYDGDEKKLKQKAGYHIYTDLIFEKQFPKEKIIICSDHFDNLGIYKKAFEDAKLIPPKNITKEKFKDSEGKKVCKMYDDPYTSLRRGIIMACDYFLNELEKEENQTDPANKTNDLKSQFGLDKIPSENFFYLNAIIEKDEDRLNIESVKDFLKALKLFLPATEPNNKDKLSILKILLRNVSHEWQTDLNYEPIKAKREIFGFNNIIKTTRNWIAHSKIFDDIAEKDVGFIFVSAMRAMFVLSNSTQEHEKILLNVIQSIDRKTESISANDVKKLMKKEHKTIFSKKGESFLPPYFYDRIVKYIQNPKNENEFSKDISKDHLYNFFWFYVNKIEKINYPKDKPQQGNFLDDFTSTIYPHSFK